MEDTRRRVSRLKMRHLSTIHAIGRTGNLQKASEYLSLSESSISKTLSEAESLMGTQLFERTPFGSRATLQGEVLMRYSARVMADLESAEEECDALLRGHSGTLTIGVFTPIGWWNAFARCVIEFQQTAPRTQLVLRQASMEQLLVELEAGNVDVVIGRWHDISKPGSIRVEPLYHDGGPAFVGRAQHPLVGKSVTIEELTLYPWFLPESPSILVTNIREVLDASALPMPRRIIYSHVYTVNLAVCAATDTLALLPSFAITDVGNSYGLHKIDFKIPSNEQPLTAILREGSAGQAMADNFVKQLKAIVCESPTR